jgi:outer-membrane receptor for ferric coprogen and ferric-rhodotorulic acid
MNRRVRTAPPRLGHLIRDHRPAPLALALRLAVAGGLFLAAGTGTALAQGTPVPQAGAAAEAAKRYDIAAGPLGNVMARFAAASGVLLAGPADLVQGRSSPGLNGSYTPSAAIDALLAGTGLEAVRQANGTYSLRQASTAATPGSSALPAVTVVATREKDGTTEGTGSYTTPAMSTATPLPLSIRETPQSVTVITRARMDDQGLTKARDVMDNTPGITSNGTAPYREGYFARGFDISNYMFDGVTIGANNSRAGMFLNDLAMFDRVEIVRGATGLMQGVGEPSAAINFIRKRPTREFQASVETHAGRWNDYGVQADLSGSLNAAGTLRGRAVVLGRDSDSFQDVATEQRQLYYFTAEADITSSTLLSVGVSRQKNNNVTTYGGLPTAPDGADLRLPRSTFLGNTWNYWDDQTTMSFAELEHRMANDWKLKFAAISIHGDQQQARADVFYNDVTGQYDQSAGKADVFSERKNFQLTAQGPVQLFGRKHDLTFGVASRVKKEGNDTAGYWNPTIATNIDIFNWTHDAPMPNFTTDYRGRQEEKIRSVYAMGRLNASDSLKVLGGLRLDWYQTKSFDDVQDFGLTTWTQYNYEFKADRHLTKYFGIVYDLNRQNSLYASYTDIFQPQDYRDASNELIEPVVGKNYELGYKGELLGGALNTSAAVFLLDQDNLAIDDGPCPFNPTVSCYRAAGTVRSKGYELELQGALSANWQIGGGYTYVSKKIHRDGNPAAVGTRPITNLPSRQLKVSSTYRVPQSSWRFGGNVRYQNRTFHTDDWMGFTYHTEQGGYTLFDAMAGYRFDKHLDIQLNVFNLFDKRYYRSMNGQPVTWGGNTVYGEPRKVLVTARYQF